MKSSRTPRLSDLIRQPAAPGPSAPAVKAPPTPVPAPQAAEELPDEPPPPAGDSPRSAVELTAPEVEARRDYTLLEQWLEGVFASASRGELECADAFDTIGAILDRPKLVDALFAETFKLPRADGQLARKSVNVTVYSLRLGGALGFDREALERLGVAALLHKIGFARLPEEVRGKRGALSRRERLVLQQHPKLGSDLLAPLGARFERAAEIVYQAHERGDGSGYPLGLRGEEISREAQIIGLVDVFEALIQPRFYRERLIPFMAVKTVLAREKSRFPRSLLREFIASFSLFPPYTYVRLNSRAIARVIETEPGHPLRPQLEIVLDAAGHKPAKPQIVRLREAPLFYITGPVSEEELSA